MIDLKKFRENPDIYIKSAEYKNNKIDFDRFLELDKKIKEFKIQIEELNWQRNQLSKEIPTKQKNKEDVSGLIQEVKNIKNKTEMLQTEFQEIESEYNDIYLRIPNPIEDEVPVWKTDEENIVMETVWKKAEFDFKPIPHRELLENRWMLDQWRSAKVSWARFFYLKNNLVRLEFALNNFVMDKLYKKWFMPTIVPNLVKEDAMVATWFFPADKSQIYEVNPWEDNLFLIWTSEVPLVAQHTNETVDYDKLPLRYVWFSSCYRREAWTYWKDTKWLIRTHQFDKIEMVSIVDPKNSKKEHELIREIEEEIFQELWICYNRILICSWDLWAPASKKYDLEAWFPWMNTFKEVTSCSNCTDFQSRRAKIKYKNNEEKDFVHTLNWTAMALGRAMAAIVETYQTKDLKIKIPEVLKKYFEEDYL